jgi:hypothetical protein
MHQFLSALEQEKECQALYPQYIQKQRLCAVLPAVCLSEDKLMNQKTLPYKIIYNETIYNL